MTIIRRAADVAIATEIDNTDHLLMEVDGATKRVALGTFKPEAGVATYATRAVFVAAVASGLSSSEGDRVSAGGLEYVYTGVNYISDLAGWEPFGQVCTLRHFGCTSDVTLNADGTFTGGTDQSSKILAAIAWVQAGANRWLDGESAAYLVTSTIAVTGGVMARNLNLLKNTNGRILQIQNTVAGPYALGTSYSEGDLDIDLASNMAAPLRPGQPFKIVSDAIDPANRDDGSAANQYRLGEWATAGRREVSAGSFVVGRNYRIKTVGTTDFTLIGATSNAAGATFSATGAGTGTGVAWDEDQGVAQITLSKPLKYFMGIDPADPALSEGLQTAGSFTTGRSYMILSVGTTDFTLIGASANTVGVVFTATGAGTGTGTAVANEAIVNGYTTAFDAKVLVPDASARVHIKDCTFCYAEGLAATVDAQAVQVKGYVDPVIEGCKVTRSYGAGFSTCNYNAIIRDCVALRCENNTSEGQYGYGISDQGGYGLKVINFSGADCRHVYTSSVITEPTSETNPLALLSTGRTMSTQITGGHGTGGNNAIWDTHHSTDNLHMLNLTAEDGNTAGFSMRGRGIRISSASVINCNAGVSIFTEYDSGDTNDDLLVAGKELQYFTNAFVNDLRVTSSLYALDFSMAEVWFGGVNVYETEQPRFIQGSGIAHISGNHSWKCTDSTTAASIILAEIPTSYGRSVFPRTKIYIDGDVTLDASGANAGVTLFEIGDLCDIVVRGQLNVTLPAGATYASFSGDGTLRTEGSGVIHVTVNGAADNSVIADFADVYGQRVTSSDGTIDWHPAQGNGQLVCLYSVVQPDSIAGTGSEIGDAFQFPNLLNIKKAMATTGEGRLHCKMHFYLDGGGAATLKWDSFGNYRSQVAMAAGETNTQLDMTISVRSATETGMTFHWQVGTGATITNEKTVNYSRVDTVADMTGSGSLIDFDPTIDVGSTLQITGYELFGTEGGLC